MVRKLMTGVAIASTQLFYGRTLSQARNSGFGVTLSFMPRLVKVVPEKSTRIKFWSTSIGLRSLLWDGPSGGILPLFLEPQNRRSYHIYETNLKQENRFCFLGNFNFDTDVPYGGVVLVV